MENDVKIVGNGIQEEDNHVLQFLDSMDSYLDLFDALSSKLRQGWLEVASARHSTGSTRINGTSLDLKPHSAATTLQVHQLVDSSLSELPISGVMISRHGFSLSKWGLPHGVKNDFEDNHADEESAAKSHAPQLRRRGPHAAPEEERQVPTSPPVITDDQVKKQRSKSLSVFGAFSSPKLREAQISFERALEIIVEIANVRSMMLAAFVKLQSHGNEGIPGVAADDALAGVANTRDKEGQIIPGEVS